MWARVSLRRRRWDARSQEQLRRVCGDWSRIYQKVYLRLAGGHKRRQSDFVERPCLVKPLREDMKVGREEIFGTVIRLCRYDDPEDRFCRRGQPDSDMAWLLPSGRATSAKPTRISRAIFVPVRVGG